MDSVFRFDFGSAVCTPAADRISDAADDEFEIEEVLLV